MNPGGTSIDVSGWTFTDDNPSGTGRPYTFPPGTIVPAGGLITVDSPFGLGNMDEVVLFNGSTMIDTYSWGPAHVTSAGRCPNGTGTFMTMVQTRNALNTCGTGGTGGAGGAGGSTP